MQVEDDAKKEEEARAKKQRTSAEAIMMSEIAQKFKHKKRKDSIKRSNKTTEMHTLVVSQIKVNEHKDSEIFQANDSSYINIVDVDSSDKNLALGSTSEAPV